MTPEPQPRKHKMRRDNAGDEVDGASQVPGVQIALVVRDKVTSALDVLLERVVETRGIVDALLDAPALVVVSVQEAALLWPLEHREHGTAGHHEARECEEVQEEARRLLGRDSRSSSD